MTLQSFTGEKKVNLEFFLAERELVAIFLEF